MTATGAVCGTFDVLNVFLNDFLDYYGAFTGRLSPVDTIITRISAYDNILFSNASTFKVELDEW
jgi:hypothetical protein